MRKLSAILLLAFLTFGMPRAAQAQVTVAPFLTSNPQFLDGSGSPLGAGCVFTYAAGTTTPLVTYSDSAGSTPNSNPVILNSGGFPQAGGIWLTSAAYKFVVKSTGGTNCSTGSTITTTDGITWATAAQTFAGIVSTGDVTLQQSTAATSGANQSSNNLKIQAKYWNGSASATESCNLQDVLGTGANPTVAFTLTCSGSSGATTFSVVPNTSFSGSVSVAGNATFKASPWYDITAYGAKCDGATDDTIAVQAALTACNAAHGGKVFVPMGTNACNIAGQLIMDGFIDCNLEGASGGSPAGATPRGWLRFTGTTSPLISCKSCFGDAIKYLYLQYTNAGFTGTFIEMGHNGVGGLDSSGNFITGNFIGKQIAGGTASVLLSLDRAIDNIVDNNQFNDAAVAIRGAANPTGNPAVDYSVKNTIKDNSFGTASGSTITTAFLQNIGESSHILNNDFELGGSAAGILAYTGSMASGGVFSGGFVGDMSGASTYTLFTIPSNGAWMLEGMTIGTISTNVTGVVMQNNASLTFMANKLANGTTIGTMFSVGTGDSLVVGGNKWQGAVSSFLTGTPASGMVEDSTSHVRLPTGTCGIPGFSFLQNNAIGWTIGSSNHMQLGYNGCGPMMSNLQLGLGSAMALISTSTADPEGAGADVGLSRGAAGIWYAGTGAAGSKAGLIQSGNTVRVASDFTTANNTSLQTITGLSWTFPAVASSYSFHCSILYSQATAAVADQFGIQAATNAPTNIAASAAVYTSVSASMLGTLATLASTTATAVATFTPSAITTVWAGSMDGTLELPASANTVNIMVQTSNGADAVTVKRGSYCQLF